MSARVAVAVLVFAMTMSATGCQVLLGADATPVPGAAATLTRSSRTPIPTPTRDASPSPAVSPAPARSPGAVASASPQASGRPVTQDEIAQIQREMERVVANASLADIEPLLLDRVSLSTPAGGQVLDRAAAADWLRAHASSGIKVTRVDPNTQTVLLEVQTEGWPARDPIEQGRVTFNLRRYAANGRTDEDNGDWKIDVIGAE